MKKENFTKLFYLFTIILVLDFILVVLLSTVNPCDNCSGTESLILIPVLSFFWLGSWGSFYFVFFVYRENIDVSNKSFFTKFYFNRMKNWLQNGSNLIMVKVVYSAVLLTLSLVSVVMFFNLVIDIAK